MNFINIHKCKYLKNLVSLSVRLESQVFVHFKFIAVRDSHKMQRTLIFLFLHLLTIYKNKLINKSRLRNHFKLQIFSKQFTEGKLFMIWRSSCAVRAPFNCACELNFHLYNGTTKRKYKKMKKNIDDKQQQAPSTIEISTIFNLPNSSWCVFNNPLYRLLHRKNEQKPHIK